jgi:alkylation response protein AidB-like acyl-CoA dehydrogenase
MDFSYPPEAESFRAELRAWLEANLPDDLRHINASEAPADRFERLREWNRVLADAGYAAIAWPPEYGGGGAGVMEQLVHAEEMARVGAPGPVNVIGVSNIAPAIMQWGSEKQKERFLRPMLRGDEIWCQGMSEPDAGSDLASLSTKAVADGDDFVVNGQKVWNTLGHLAGWCELFVRTDPDAPKHKGISCLLVDMSLPGVEVRPLVTITGGEEFNEIFFTDVRVPRSALLGPMNDGWRVAMTTLTYERAGVARLYLGVRQKVERLLDAAKRTPRNGGTAADDPVIRERLARVYLEAEYLKLLAYRAMSADLHGRDASPASSLIKLVWSDVESHIAEVAGDVLGPAANRGEWGRNRLSVRSLSIAGGTTQINKNVVAQRVLGLPRA